MEEHTYVTPEIKIDFLFSNRIPYFFTDVSIVSLVTRLSKAVIDCCVEVPFSLMVHFFFIKWNINGKIVENIYTEKYKASVCTIPSTQAIQLKKALQLAPITWFKITYKTLFIENQLMAVIIFLRFQEIVCLKELKTLINKFYFYLTLDHHYDINYWHER